MKAILSRHVLFLFLLAAGFLTVGAAVCHRAVRTLSANQAWVSHTYDVLKHLDAAENAMILAERNQRNYVITGHEAMLDAYADTARRVDAELGAVAELTVDDAGQQERLAILRSVVAARMRSLDDAVDAYHSGGIDASRARILSGDGLRLMDQATRLLDEMERRENALLTARTRQSAHSLRNLVLTFVLIALLSVGQLGVIFVSVRREVLNRLEAERHIRESESRLLLAVDAAEMGIWERNLLTDAGTYSDRFYRIFGLPVPAAGAKTTPPREQLLNCIHPDDRARVAEAVSRSTDPAKRGEYWIEYRVLWPDGDVRWVRAQGRTIFDGAGPARRPVRLVGTVIDVTEQKHAEDALRQAKDAAERAASAADHASKAKDQFLAVLSHELRTPLTPVLAAVSDLEQRPDLPSPLRDELATVRRNVEMEARLIDDLLDLTRIVRGKVRLHPEVVDAHSLIDSVVAMFGAPARDQRLTLTTDFAAPRHHVWADPGRLQQIVWNLLSNALKFTPGGGTITVRTRNAPAQHSELTTQHSLILEVSDTGIGIPAEAIPRLFNAFEQAEQTIARKYGGLGLGLSIAKAIADLHHARLDAHSPGPGRGTTLRLTLKTADDPNASPAPAKPTPSGAGPAPAPAPAPPKLRILLVEDNEDTRRLMGRLLRTFGHRVEAADCVTAALDLASRESFDLLVSDIGLPDGTGWELMSKLGDRRPPKAIALSGFGMEDDLRRSRDAGFLEHMTKPINITALRETIDRVASESDAPAPRA